MPELPEVEHVKRGIEPYIKKTKKLRKLPLLIMLLKEKITIGKQLLKKLN